MEVADLFCILLDGMLTLTVGASYFCSLLVYFAFVSALVFVVSANSKGMLHRWVPVGSVMFGLCIYPGFLFVFSTQE